MEAVGVQKLYEPSPTLILYVGLRLAANVLGSMPLMPFLLGNSSPTIPHKLRQHLRCKFPHRLADAAGASGKKGRNDYEVNQWLWQFGRANVAWGGLSAAAATEELRITVVKGAAKKAAATRVRRSRKAPEAAGAH